MALFAVVLILMFAMQTSSQKHESIILPTGPTEAPAEQTQVQLPEDNFLQVTNHNVLMALQSLNRPVSYHQTYQVTVGADEFQSVKTVEMWVNGSFLRAEITDQQWTKVIISNGEMAYLWYEGSEAYISIRLENRLAEEDLLGLPDFDAFLELQQEDVVDADYLVLEDPPVQCIYVCTQDDDGDTSRYWVSLENGLLYQSDVLENSKQVYKIRETQYELLAAEDESFANRFFLPDGTDPFPTVTGMQQP